MSEFSTLIDRYSGTVHPDETPLQFCRRVAANGHSALELTVLLRDLFGLCLEDCAQVIGVVIADDSGDSIECYFSCSKSKLAHDGCPNKLMRLRTLGFISDCEVVQAIAECYYDDDAGLARVVARLKSNKDNDFSSIAVRLESAG